ncbi:hypothetical protein V8G54_005475 [Vigna mungo]|uniref:Uncharacterized protein n=1 Tax=Vigna mungo TaxID=3915 RepID=A0AAQ3S6G2_VIGMU
MFLAISPNVLSPFPSSPNLCLITKLSFGFRESSTSSRASLSRAGCLLLSPLTPPLSTTPLMNSSCVVICLEFSERMDFDAFITSWYLSGDILALSIISSSVGDL